MQKHGLHGLVTAAPPDDLCPESLPAACLFDLDGVLLDACDWHFEALNRALFEELGVRISRRDHECTFNGLPTRTKLAMLGVAECDRRRIEDLKQRYTLELIRRGAAPDPDKIELLDFLKHQEHVRLACVTNSIRASTQAMLEAVGIASYFDIVVSNEDVVFPKPHPEPYEIALRLLHQDGLAALAVEDSEKGAQAVGASSVRYLWRVRNAREVTLRGFLRSWRELRSLAI